MEPVKLFFYQIFGNCCCYDAEKSKEYTRILKEYDLQFEFHNLLLIENKVDLFADILFKKKNLVS